MEYKKNRQGVILESLKTLKPLDSNSLVLPAFLRESKGSRALGSAHKSLQYQRRRLKERTARLLESPSRNDPVYRVLQRLFKATGPCHLTRAEKTKRVIRREARQRFMLGYPPRKSHDISMVDAINWEWIIHCAQHCSDDIVIVSRDSDFGCVYADTAILNDWLLQEFKERVSRKRSIVLTNRLAQAFKRASIKVTEEEEKSEETFLQQAELHSKSSNHLSLANLFSLPVGFTKEDIARVVENILSADAERISLPAKRPSNPGLSDAGAPPSN